MADYSTGLWLVGARGAVATTVAVGLSALRRGDAETIGLVTESPAMAGVDLARWGQIVLGGHEVRRGTLVEAAAELESQRVTPQGSAKRYADDLAEIDGRIRPGVLHRSGEAITRLAGLPAETSCSTPREAIARIASDLEAFQRSSNVDRLVVVLLGSTEPPVLAGELPATWADLDATLDDPERCPLRASSLYAIAALSLGAGLVNFTPSLGAGCPAIDEYARQQEAPHAGADAKTGETLLKSALAPVFAARNLRVDSWVGHNLLGNRDGEVLADPRHKAAKLDSKQRLLAELLGYEPESLVTIEAIQSLGDWKTAWDHVHFRGFLGVPMTLQLTWQGSDSALAAPLVLDLARLMDLALRRGESGAVAALAAFFKDPIGASSHAVVEQAAELSAWACGGSSEGA